MYETLDRATVFVLDYYSKNEKSNTCLCTYRKYLNEFRAYLVSECIKYSHNGALEWLCKESIILSYNQYKVCRRMIYRVNDFILNGAITQREYVYLDFLAYKALEQPQKDLLNEFLESKNGNNHTNNNCRNILSSLLLCLQEAGFFLKENKITSSYLDEYFFGLGKLAPKRFFLPPIMRFLYLKGLVCISNDEIWKYFGIDLDLIDDTSTILEMETRKNTKSQVINIVLGPEILRILIHYLNENKYSKSIYFDTIISFFRILAFLSVNSLSFSSKLLYGWAKANRSGWTKYLYFSIAKTIQLIELLSSNAKLDARKVPTNNLKALKYIPPPWSQEIVNSYLSERKREGMEISTLYMSRSSCCKFLLYAESKGIHSVTYITVNLVKEYNKQDKHKTIEGKQAHNSKLRIFFRYLVTQGILPSAMMLAVPTIFAPKVAITTVLSKKEMEGIINYRITCCESPDELKDNAIIALGLQLGLRACDVVRLKLKDIDWNHCTLKIIQKKTGKPLVTALPVNVANLLYRYISKGRPKSDLPYVFLHHNAPFSKYSAGKCSKSLTMALKDTPKTSPGFHITRRTFATNLLISGTPVQIVKSALGQSDLSQLNHYLGVDLVHLRLCPINLEGINLPGRLL